MPPLPSNDEQWQAFLRQHRPTPPPAAPNLEEQLMNRVEASRSPLVNRRLLAVPPRSQQVFSWSGVATVP